MWEKMSIFSRVFLWLASRLVDCQKPYALRWKMITPPTSIPASEAEAEAERSSKIPQRNPISRQLAVWEEYLYYYNHFCTFLHSLFSNASWRAGLLFWPLCCCYLGSSWGQRPFISPSFSDTDTHDGLLLQQLPPRKSHILRRHSRPNSFAQAQKCSFIMHSGLFCL